jgi:transposase
MHRLREILRQKWQGRSHRQIAGALHISASTVAAVASDAKALSLDEALVEGLSDAELEARMYPQQESGVTRPEPDCAALHLEMRRPGVTLALLHHEFQVEHPDGIHYTAFCNRYRTWKKLHSPVMRQVHVAGDKLFVDYAGMKPKLVCVETGQVTEVELFVAVLGASNYTYVEATRTQQVPDFVSSVARTLSFLGGVPRAIVPDQLKSAVVLACRYDPGIQRTTADLGRHYDTAIVPARPKSPRDKAKVEVGVQIAERWILARIRNETFATLGALNLRLRELNAELNERVMARYKASRKELFVRLEKSELRPLPSAPFECAVWKKVMLGADYHVTFDSHAYSAPHALRHDAIDLWVRATTNTIEIISGNARVATHPRSHVIGGATTLTGHMPHAHRAHADWVPAKAREWAETVGPYTLAFCDAVLKQERHPSWGSRACLGLYRLAHQYGKERMEAACCRGLNAGAHGYRSISTILKHNLDSLSLPPSDVPAASGASHENVRGPEYYH